MGRTIIVLTEGQEKLLLEVAELPEHLLFEPGRRAWLGRQLAELGLAEVIEPASRRERVCMAATDKGREIARSIVERGHRTPKRRTPCRNT